MPLGRTIAMLIPGLRQLLIERDCISEILESARRSHVDFCEFG